MYIVIVKGGLQWSPIRQRLSRLSPTRQRPTWQGPTQHGPIRQGPTPQRPTHQGLPGKGSPLKPHIDLLAKSCLKRQETTKEMS